MRLYFKDVLAGKGVGSFEEQCDSRVNGAIVTVVKAGEMSVTRGEFQPGYRFPYGAGSFPGKPDNANTPASGGRGNCGDGIPVDQDLLACPSICRVITYCWAIESRLFTTQ